MSASGKTPPLFPGRRGGVQGEVALSAPLADRMRPRTLGEFVGQEAILGEGRFLSSVLSARPLPSLIFWGPPGSGKSTLARIIATETAHPNKRYQRQAHCVKLAQQAV